MVVMLHISWLSREALFHAGILAGWSGRDAYIHGRDNGEIFFIFFQHLMKQENLEDMIPNPVERKTGCFQIAGKIRYQIRVVHFS